MRRLSYTTAAVRNLTDISEYIASHSNRATAEAFVGALLDQCERLAVLPGTLGRARPELRPEIRSFALKGYVIFFHYRGEMLEVVNVLEGHRDILGYFGGEGPL